MATAELSFDAIEKFHIDNAADEGQPAIILYTPNTYHYTLLDLHDLSLHPVFERESRQTLIIEYTCQWLIVYRLGSVIPYSPAIFLASITQPILAVSPA